jgi:hypothetical protein
MNSPPKFDPRMRKAENLSINEISKKYPGKRFNSPQAQRELKMALKRNYNAAGLSDAALGVEKTFIPRYGLDKTAGSIMPLLARTGLGAAAGGFMGYRHGDAVSDGSPKSRMAGAAIGALTGGLVGAGMHGFRRLAGSGASFNSRAAEDILMGIAGTGLAAGAGLGGSKVLKKNQPDLYRPDYVTESERRENADIQQLVSDYNAAGHSWDRMDPDKALMLRRYMKNPATQSRVTSAFRAAQPRAVKQAAYLQMYANDGQGHRSLVPYNDPRAVKTIQSAAFQESLRKRIALAQLQRMQQIRAMAPMLSSDYRNRYADHITREYLAGHLAKPKKPSEEDARNMISQYMSSAGVDTSSSKARKAADKYDGSPSTKKRNTEQNPVRIKSESKKEKTAGFTLKDIQTMEKVSGDMYPTVINSDGSITKTVNGSDLRFNHNGMQKVAGPLDMIASLGTKGKVGLGLAGLAGLGLGGYKLHEYINRDRRTTGQKFIDAGKAMAPSLIKSYNAYQAMQRQIDAAAAGGQNSAMANQPANPTMQGLGLDPGAATLTPEMRQRLAMMQVARSPSGASGMSPMDERIAAQNRMRAQMVRRGIDY